MTRDTTSYNDARLLRLPLSKHHKGYYCNPIELHELNLSVDEIKDLPTLDVDSIIDMWDKAKLPEQLKELTKKEVEQKITGIDKVLNGDLKNFVDIIDFAKKPPYLTASKYVLEMGYIPRGYGQVARMILAASYKKAGKLDTQAYHSLLATSELRAKLYGEDAAFDKEELWNNVIKTVYSESWQGGTYSVDHPLLSEIETKLPSYLRQRKKKENLIDNESVFTKFKRFARDIDKNTLSLGIPAFDKKVKLLTSTACGIVGAPGCHAKGSGILMYDGTIKKVEDIEVGDLLTTNSGLLNGLILTIVS
jgi:hypothetical protein